MSEENMEKLKEYQKHREAKKHASQMQRCQ